MCESVPGTADGDDGPGTHEIPDSRRRGQRGHERRELADIAVGRCFLVKDELASARKLTDLKPLNMTVRGQREVFRSASGSTFRRCSM